MTCTRLSGRRFGPGALLVALLACNGSKADWVVAKPAPGNVGEQIHITGVVHFFEPEGGFYAIRGSDGMTYDPTNLPAEFRKEGQGVEADARRRADVIGIHQVGVIIDLERIRAR